MLLRTVFGLLTRCGFSVCFTQMFNHGFQMSVIFVVRNMKILCSSHFSRETISCAPLLFSLTLHSHFLNRLHLLTVVIYFPFNIPNAHPASSHLTAVTCTSTIMDLQVVCYSVFIKSIPSNVPALNTMSTLPSLLTIIHFNTAIITLLRFPP